MSSGSSISGGTLLTIAMKTEDFTYTVKDSSSLLNKHKKGEIYYIYARIYFPCHEISCKCKTLQTILSQ